jgi:hypothetical protein
MGDAAACGTVGGIVTAGSVAGALSVVSCVGGVSEGGTVMPITVALDEIMVAGGITSPVLLESRLAMSTAPMITTSTTNAAATSPK